MTPFATVFQQLRCHEVRTEQVTGIYLTAYSGKTAAVPEAAP